VNRCSPLGGSVKKERFDYNHVTLYNMRSYRSNPVDIE